jgi:hypothetical protein
MTTQPISSGSFDSSPRSTHQRVVGVAVSLMVVMPGIALAQSHHQPFVELGAQVSKRSDVAPGAWALHLAVPLKPGRAIEVTADTRKSYLGDIPMSYLGRDENARISVREFGVQWRQTVFTSGRLRIFGVVGGGRNRVETDVPGRIVPGRERGFDTFVDSEFVAHLGPAVQVELAPWLALRGDVRGTLGEHSGGVRGMVGAVIPIRRSGGSDPPSAPAPATTTQDAKPRTAGPMLPPAEWRRVKPGREVWVTTNTGSLVHGEIAAISDSSLILREQDREVTIMLDDVRLVEGRDSAKDGFLIGAVPAAVAGGLLFGGVASHCGGSACVGDPDTGSAALAGAVTGAAVGGLIGAMVDWLIPGRQTLFGGGTTVVTPVMTPTKKAVDVTVRWR